MTQSRIRRLAYLLICVALAAGTAAIPPYKSTAALVVPDRVAIVYCEGCIGLIVKRQGEMPRERVFGPIYFERGSPSELAWRPILWWSEGRGIAAIPTWQASILMLFLGGMTLYRTRHLPGHCKHCRYNLTGLPPNSPCPECGRHSQEVRT